MYGGEENYLYSESYGRGESGGALVKKAVLRSPRRRHKYDGKKQGQRSGNLCRTVSERIKRRTSKNLKAPERASFGRCKD